MTDDLVSLRMASMEGAFRASFTDLHNRFQEMERRISRMQKELGAVRALVETKKLPAIAQGNHWDSDIE